MNDILQMVFIEFDLLALINWLNVWLRYQDY